MKIYLAARMSRQFEMQGYRADLLRRTNHIVTSRWIDERHKTDEEERAIAPAIARRDLDDLSISDTVVLFGEARGTVTNHGRLVELGIGLGMGLDCYVIGNVENVFCYLPRQFPDWESFVSVLERPRMRDLWAPSTLAI